jgi:hypothetical protein
METIFRNTTTELDLQENNGMPFVWEGVTSLHQLF